MNYIVRILPNNRLLVRDTELGTSKVLKATEVSSYFEKLLEDQIKAQDAEDAKIRKIKGSL